MLWDKKGGEPGSESLMWIILAVVFLISMIGVVSFALVYGGEAMKDRACYYTVKARVNRHWYEKIFTSEMLPSLCYTKDVIVRDDYRAAFDFVNEIENCVKRFEPALKPERTDALIDKSCFVCSRIRFSLDVEPIKNKEIVNELIANDAFNVLVERNFYVPTNREGVFFTEDGEGVKRKSLNEDGNLEEFYEYAVVYYEKGQVERAVGKFSEWIDSRLREFTGESLLKKKGDYYVFAVVEPYTADHKKECYP